MRILIIGSNGQLGGDLAELIRNTTSHHLTALNRVGIDVTDPQSCRLALETYLPDVVINTAAFHKVDVVEKAPGEAFAVNAIGPWNLAQLCCELNMKLMTISTDYVFGGDLLRRQPYTEDDLPAPVNVYGYTKLAGEHLVKSAWNQHYIVRTSGLYGPRGASGKGGNFVETMLRLAQGGGEIKVVDDQRLTPTYTMALAREIVLLIETGGFGLYHMSSEGHCSWHEFAAKIFELTDLHPRLIPVTSAEFPTVAKRPTYSVLAKQALASAGLPGMLPWQDALADYLRRRGL